MNVPNLLTIARLFMVPAFVLCYVKGCENAWAYGIYWAAGLFVLAALTDILDGYIARKYNQITDFGKLADPLADKMMQVAAIACLAVYDRISAWIFYVFLAKELLLLFGSARLLKRFKFVVYSKWSGKIATVVLFICIVLIIVSPGINQLTATIMMTVCIVFTLVALFNYLQIYLNVKENRLQKNETVEE
ncbi:MAG: CDP-diacylglycerol--glycerol-3-phosphate 3-phosphatidyltransferase [Clostridia bacterium]|nr:CDP-diacylglycerol--glycerol-3-phosphate 3-phosphatidyltransferase [Clostridia bacterium]